MSSYRELSLAAGCYIEFTRNTPLLVQLFFVFFALPSLGLRLSPIEAACIALAWNNGAYMAEILRAGLQSIPKSQLEAGHCLGMSAFHVFCFVQLPPALANVYPAMIGQFMIIFLNSSAASTIGVDDLAGTASYIQSQTLRAFEIYMIVTGLYFALGLVIRLIFFLLGPARTRRFSFLLRIFTSPATSRLVTTSFFKQ
jgi:polar amino acid transport system permease protein